MTDTVHCSHCGAPFREEDARFCSFCGTQRQLAQPAVVVAAAPSAPNAIERFERAERHPRMAELLKRTPSTLGHGTSLGCSAGGLVVFCVVGILITITFAKNGGGFSLLFPLAITLVGAFMLAATLKRAARFTSAELRRTIALVVDERVSVSGGRHAHTTYFATLEWKSRTRREFSVNARLAGKIAPNDLGVAYMKADVLLDFERLDV